MFVNCKDVLKIKLIIEIVFRIKCKSENKNEMTKSWVKDMCNETKMIPKWSRVEK